MKYRLLFYKSKWGDWKWIDNLISLVTLVYNWFSPDAAHVEVWLPDSEGVFCGMGGGLKVISPYSWYGTCLTSTMRGDNNGTVMRPASEVLKHPARWFYYEFECEEVDFDMARQWADRACLDNKGYGKLTLLKFIGINCVDKLRKICSQIGYKWSTLCGNFDMPKGKDDGRFVVSPRRLAAMCEKLGLERKEL
jgi:hypothetical protein